MLFTSSLRSAYRESLDNSVTVVTQRDAAQTLGPKPPETSLSFGGLDEMKSGWHIVFFQMRALLFICLALVTTALAQPVDPELEALRARVKEEPVEARIGLAEALFERGRHKEAWLEYRWIWMYEIEPGKDPVRAGFFLDQIPPQLLNLLEARSFLEGVASRLSRVIRGANPDPVKVGFWVVVQSRLDPEVAVVWYLSLENAGASNYDHARPWIFKELTKQERWKEAGLVFPDPIPYAENLMNVWTMIAADNLEMQSMVDAWAAETFGNLYRSLYAASRPHKAEELKRAVLEKMEAPIVEKAFQKS